MYFFRKKKFKKTVFRGFTLIEALVSLFVFSVITLAFYQSWSLATYHIINTKNRLGATALANEQMEIARSIIFDNVGTTTGIPSGTITAYQTIAANTTVYAVHTVVQYVDDPIDGTSALGTDSAPNDYKKVTITVTWGGGTAAEEVEITSNFSLDGVESVAVGTGVLSINVLNNAGEGVSGADVHVVNSTVSPSVDFTADTDALGGSVFPGALASEKTYEVNVSKTGYYGVMTYPPYPTSSFNPINMHASVVTGSLTPVTLVTDRVSTIAFRTRDPFDADVSNIDFSISGGLIIGTDPASLLSVYDFSQDASTDGSGEKNFNDRSSGLYTVTLDAGETQYQYLRLTPEETTFGTISLLPNTSSTVHMVLANKTLSSALITVKATADDTPIAAASVHLTDTISGYDATVDTDTYGQAYFPTVATPLVAGTYDVSITASGFTTETGTIVITGTQLNKKTFSLNVL